MRLFTTKSKDVLHKNKASIRKIIEFTDQAPSQYKNKTAFKYMSQSKIPIMKISLVSTMERVHVMHALEE